jgi:hypothetical protein
MRLSMRLKPRLRWLMRRTVEFIASRRALVSLSWIAFVIPVAWARSVVAHLTNGSRSELSAAWHQSSSRSAACAGSLTW